MSDKVAEVEEKVPEDFVEKSTVSSKKSSPKKSSVVMSFEQFVKGKGVDKYIHAYWAHEYHAILKAQVDWEKELKEIL